MKSLFVITMFIAFTTMLSVNATLIANYDFGDGNLTNDSSGNGHTLAGPLGGTATITATNDAIGSAHFDGSGGDGFASYFQVDLTNPGAIESFSISCWWKTAQLNQDTYASLLSTINTPSTYDWQIDDNLTNIRVFGRTGNFSIPQSSLLPDTWYHMVLISDVSSSTNVYLYLTKQGSRSVSLAGSLSDRVFTLETLRIGGNRAGNYTYDSDIAIVKVYDEAIDTAMLNALLAEGPNGIPIAHYDFSDGNLTNDSASAYTLREYNAAGSLGDGGISLTEKGYAEFTGAGSLKSPGTSAETEAFTVSYWWRTADLIGADNYQGPVFSTITGSHPNQDWQFSTFGDFLEIRDTATLFTTPRSSYPDNTWYHTVIQSPPASSNLTVWISTEGGSLNKVAANVPGNYTGLVLKSFIFGTNRKGDYQGTFDMGTAKIFDVELNDASIGALFAEGPGLIQFPGGTIMLVE